MLRVRADAPLDPYSLDILETVVSAANALGSEVILVGASARDVVLTHVYAIPLLRATADIDFAVAIQGWAAYRALIAYLLDGPRFTERHKVIHRLYYEPPGLGHAVPVDIVPFGHGLGGARFRWPDDPDTEMNVEGYPDAARAAAEVDVGGIIVKVLTPPRLALLKLFAWNDRHAETRKDASDLFTLIQNYSELGNIDRLYDEPDLLDDVGHDYARGSARLLGRDVRRMCGEDTMVALQSILGPVSMNHLIRDAYIENRSDNVTMDAVGQRLMDFADELRL